MKEIRWHGRGGNGGFTAARLLGMAASIYSGVYAQAFPSFGPERRGAPVLGFTRIDEKPISDHSQIDTCDCVIVLDETLLDIVDVVSGLKEDGVLVINSAKDVVNLKLRKELMGIKHMVSIDATALAMTYLGTPIVNTAMLGAAAGSTGLVSMESIADAIDNMMSPALREKNKTIASIAYTKAKGE